MKVLSKIFDTILRGVLYFGVLLVILMAIFICYEVVARYFFNWAPLWINDFVEYSLLVITFIGASYVLKEDRHIEVDLVTQAFSVKTQFSFKIVTSLMSAAICLLMTFYGFDTVWDNYVRNVNVVKTMDFPKFVPLLSIALGCTFLGIEFIRRAFRYIGEKKAEAKRIERIHEGVA